MSQKRRLRRAASRRGWIRMRYCLPAVTLLVTLLFGFFPCHSFFSAQAGYTDSLSLWAWLGERLETSRGNLANTDGTILSAEAIRFVQVEFALLIGLILCFLLGAVACVYLSLKALEIMRSPREYDGGRILFMTLVPNRIVFCLWQLLLFPLLLFPHIWVWLAGQMLPYELRISLSFAEPWMITAVLFVVQCVLSILCAKWERVGDCDVFCRHRVDPSEEESEFHGTEEPSEETEDALRQFKAEQIRRLLGNDGEDSNQDKTEKD
ncbi:MAG: hypothetical protein IJY42_05795 [Clostridia bacterium]|nr:hypothetical protein [Clostridia bacterium]